ncbi:MAG TPA: hypothetical protein VLG47_04105 [Candidatus Saccharimonadales bacterium]|nr:hypothetical protein [Candidatus Saccharimonadales bacterium]
MYAVVFHAHQKLDRVAYRHLRHLVGRPDSWPVVSDILHFEGKRGPDAIKLKSNPTAGEYPWHFVDPFDTSDKALIKTINEHYNSLVQALKKSNSERVAFEAAWLAHALVDGLTPAHHYPYEAELKDLRGGRDHKSKTTVMRRITIQGKTHRESFKRSFKLVGPKGLMMTHTAFEGGAFMIILPLSLDSAMPSKTDLANFKELGLTAFFQQQAREIGALNLYERFYKFGWTPKLARLVRKEMAPRMAQVVTLAWYSALVDSGKFVPEIGS